MMRSGFLTLIAIVIAGGVLASSSSAIAQTAEMTPREVTNAIRTMIVDLQQASELLEKLDSTDYHVREQATTRLHAMKLLPAAELRDLVESTASPEVRFRAMSLLDADAESDKQSPGLTGILGFFVKQRISGMASEILTLIDNAGMSTQPILREALSVTVTADDFALLESQLDGAPPEKRISVIVAMGNLRHADTADCILPFASDPSEPLRLQVGIALARTQRRECVAVLAGLLTSDDKQVRTTAANTLQKSTGLNQGYFRAEDAAERQQVSEAWLAWLGQQPNSLKLRPLRSATARINPFNK